MKSDMVDRVGPEAGLNPWDALNRELDAWRAAGRRATFWWRDDDATRPGPNLDRLLRTAAGAPLSLAVIPGPVDDALPAALAGHPSATVLQHGYAHINHGQAGEKKSEFPPSRDPAPVMTELSAGRDRLQALFGANFRPVLVPPWNRVGPFLPDRLAETGLAGISTYRRKKPVPTPFQWVDTHCDIIAWRTTRGFVGDGEILALATGHLAARRLGAVLEEPTGLLTHHIVHDERCWQFLARFATVVADHPAASWCDPFDGVRLQ